MYELQHTAPTAEESTKFSLRAYKGIDVGLGHDDPGATIARTLEQKYPGHLILIQSGKFLQGYDRTAYTLYTLKQYKLKLVGTTSEPHIRVGFPIGNFNRRLWQLVQEFGIPYVVSLGSQAEGRVVYVSQHPELDSAVLTAVSDAVVAEVIHDLQQRGALNKASAKALLANPDTSVFKLKSQAQDLDLQLLQDIIRMPRDLRATHGENLRACMARIMRGVFAYGLEDNKTQLLKGISADVDLVKHYLVQGQRLSKLKAEFEHRAGLAVELGRLVGGLIRTNAVQP
ncbi:hypothetical protein GJ700_12480 [Duganella sp. FT92W]|uniref:Uncharacterized protein n=1 Tax=Pseudoduganella rivuli TaxID=2666085 RepID=A0A7X2LSR1_9BURK|nr:hypothetical protein [Pseudoduganella rivuli]MRV72526.1 hypothetical protein [Pseudoduganella rivuli]